VELVQRGEFARASRHVREAIRINPRCADAYYNIGKIHANLGENREAIKAFEKTIALDPEYADAYLKLITIHLETGNKPAAMAAFQALRLVDRTRAFPGNL
jgi:tetratricopeptide (TPR) repeat protein